MATLKEHAHVFKKDISNYVKSFLILLIMDITLTCLIALSLFQIVECASSTSFQQQNDQILWTTSQKLCQSYKEWNTTTTTTQQNEELNKMNEHLKKLCVKVWQTTKTTLESENNKCTLTWLKFTKWFYLASMTAKALGKLKLNFASLTLELLYYIFTAVPFNSHCLFAFSLVDLNDK